VVQADKLMTKLKQSYRPPAVSARWTGKVRLKEAVPSKLLAAAERMKARLVLTGLSSAQRYVTLATEPILSFYCSAEPRDLLRAAHLDASPSVSFPSVELLQTDDQSVYFDPRPDGDAITSSPLQVWLELSTGDKRTHEAAENVRKQILEHLERKTEHA
jgi:hypothetical protein